MKRDWYERRDETSWLVRGSYLRSLDQEINGDLSDMGSHTSYGAP